MAQEPQALLQILCLEVIGGDAHTDAEDLAGEHFSSFYLELRGRVTNEGGIFIIPNLTV